jgi:FkbM family methyltransferase
MFNTLIKSVANKFGYTIGRNNIALSFQHSKPVTPEQFFDVYFGTIQPEKFFFVQVGAHNGNFVDPLHDYVKKYNLKGLLVEPQPDLFLELQKTYLDYPQLQFANVAVSNSSQTLYTIKDIYKQGIFSTRGTGIASLDREHFKMNLAHELELLKKQNITLPAKNLDDYVEAISVKTETFTELLETRAIPKVDYVQIDCEGYDYEIIKMIDFQKFNPQIINYESRFLSPADQIDCEQYLIKNGYQTFRYKSDTCAFKTKTESNPSH